MSTTGSFDFNNKQHIVISGSSLQFKKGTGSADEIGRWEIAPDDGQSLQFRVPKAKFGGNTDRIAFYVSASGKIGIGTKDPEEAFDVRDMAEDIAETDEERAEFTDAEQSKRKKLFQASRTEANQKISGSLEGNAKTATTIATARTFRTNLGSTSAVSFDGSSNVTPGVTGTLPVSNGGTGFSTVPNKAVIISQDSGTDTLSGVQMDGSGELLIGGASGPAVSTLTAGTNITIENGDGSITIAAAGGTTKSAEEVQDIAGAMFSSNTETGITATYQDADGTIDLVVTAANKGHLTSHFLVPTDFYYCGYNGEDAAPNLCPDVYGRWNAASAAGYYQAQVVLPNGKSPTHVVVYGSDTRNTVRVYMNKFTDGTTATQIDGGRGFAVGTNTALSGTDDFSANEMYLTILVQTVGTDNIYGGIVTFS